MNASLYRSILYDPEKSFVPIAEVATGVLALVVHPSLNVSTFSELIALARSKPGEINYLAHVPYACSAGAVKDIAGGHVSAMYLPIHTALPLAATGQIRILAVGSQAMPFLLRPVHRRTSLTAIMRFLTRSWRSQTLGPFSTGEG